MKMLCGAGGNLTYIIEELPAVKFARILSASSSTGNSLISNVSRAEHDEVGQNIATHAAHADTNKTDLIPIMFLNLYFDNFFQ